MTVYETLVGTSFTAPHVGCVAALLAARGLSSTVIVDCPAHDRVEPRPFDPAMGYGIVNASAAVREC